MDPTPLGYAEWTDIGGLLRNLWLIVALIIFFATNIIVGQIFIPSLVASHQLPVSLSQARPVFLVLAVVSFGLAVIVLAQTIALADVLERIYDTYWIDGGLD
jgi:hypothetical protein